MWRSQTLNDSAIGYVIGFMSKRLQSGHCTDALCLAVRTNAFLKTKMCPKLDSCPLGKNCSFAHSERELRPLPEFKKTAICYNYRRGRCFDPRCKFAHGEDEMMGYIPDPGVQSRKICPYNLLGVCFDPNCLHAHLQSRRAVSRLKTFLIALRNTLSQQMLADPYMSVSNIKKQLKGGIPWQSLGFVTFREAVLFLPGTSVSEDEQFVEFTMCPETRELIQTLQAMVDTDSSIVTDTRSWEPPESSISEEDVHQVMTPISSLFLTSTINCNQIVGSVGGHSDFDFFTCPLCGGLSVDPMINEKCSHVMCASCFEMWKGGLDVFVCPKCQAETPTDEVNVISPESPRTMPAALGIIYDSIQVACESCDWIGSPRMYPLHVCHSPDTP